MKLLTALLAGAIALFAITGCGGGSSGSGGGNGNNGNGVTMVGVNNSNGAFPFAFQSPVTVKSGSKVQWMNNTAASHGITWESVVPNTSPAAPATVPVFGPNTMSGTATMPVVTTQTTYNYQCTIHGASMPGQINVTP
jgi:plastocyanin